MFYHPEWLTSRPPAPAKMGLLSLPGNMLIRMWGGPLGKSIRISLNGRALFREDVRSSSLKSNKMRSIKTGPNSHKIVTPEGAIWISLTPRGLYRLTETLPQISLNLHSRLRQTIYSRTHSRCTVSLCFLELHQIDFHQIDFPHTLRSWKLFFNKTLVCLMI